MASQSPSRRALIARHAAYQSWAATPDREGRTRAARRNSPAELEWHLARLDADRFADATDEQRHAAAEAARRAYYVGIALKSSRSRGAK